MPCQYALEKYSDEGISCIKATSICRRAYGEAAPAFGRVGSMTSFLQKLVI